MGQKSNTVTLRKNTKKFKFSRNKKRVKTILYGYRFEFLEQLLDQKISLN
jgi:hypothetical protein